MRLLTLGALLGLTTTASAQQLQALKFARVVAGNGTVIPNGVVIVSGDTVLRVQEARAALPRDAKVVDLTKYTAIPGMIDVHTHITYSYDPESGLDPWNQGPRMYVAGVGLSRRRLTNDSLIEAAVKTQVDHGADYIKMYGSTGSGADVTGTETS